MTEKDRLMSYRMFTLLPPPEGIYKNEQALTKGQREEFNQIDNLADAHAFYTCCSEMNYTDEFRKVLLDME